jgi:hypothetical protein
MSSFYSSGSFNDEAYAAAQTGVRFTAKFEVV